MPAPFALLPALPADGAALAVVGTAAGIGFLHTLLGPDHYLPFVMLARARGWGRAKTLTVTAACGVGHVAASLALSVIGIVAGVGIGQIKAAEYGRGPWAAWALVAFGVAYLAWGVRKAWRRRQGVELHEHHGHLHLHRHGVAAHDHPAGADGGPANGDRGSFWVLFAIFVLGPCEPLIPLFLLPASEGNWGLALWAAAAFGVATLGTMLATGALALTGARAVRLGPLERWADAMAGGLIAASGLAVLFLGL